MNWNRKWVQINHKVLTEDAKSKLSPLLKEPSRSKWNNTRTLSTLWKMKIGIWF
jgi:hypothetical protein